MNFKYKKDVEWYLSSGDLSELNLSYRTWAALMRGGVNSVEKLSAMSEDGLLGLRDVGLKSVEEIREALKNYKGVKE